MADSNLDSELTKLKIDKSRKKRRRRGPWKKILLVLVVIGFFVGWSEFKKRMPVEVEVVRPVVEKVESSAMFPVLTAGGYVIPRDSIDVSSKIVGRVEEIYVDRGDKVKAGDVLLKLEDDEQRAQLALAEAQVNAAKAQLSELQTGSRPEEIAAARAGLASAEATLKNASNDWERLRALTRNNAVSQQELDRAKASYRVAEANAESARKNLELIEKGPRIEQIEAAQAVLKQAEASLDLAKTQLDYTVIRAPIDWTILEKVAERGELLTNINVGGSRGVQSSAVLMADLTDLQVEIDLNETELAKVRPDQATEIRLDSAPDKVYEGKVDEIAPQADRQKATVQVKVDFLNPDEQVRPEVNARVTFMEERKAASLAAGDVRVWIPRSVIIQDESGQHVLVVIEGRAELRTIQAGVEGEKGVLVREGLGGNELIIASTEGIAPEKKVKVTSE